jgi:muramidase (phage lysozyme)
MFNVQQITSRLADMSDAQLAQYARMHKDDPYVLPLAASEFKRRQQIRQSGQMQQGGPKPTVADQELAQMGQEALPEDRGIGVLPAENIATMADGGIAGYAEGGPVSFAGGGGTEKGGKFDPDVYLQNPNVQKFLQYLNIYEGAPQANHLVGFKKFEGFQDHPRTPVVFNKKGATSDAAGLFQIKGKTWDYQKKKLGLTDFSPENQKRAAIGILKDIKALPDIVEGNFDAAKAKAARQWASLPGSTIGKSTGQIPRLKPQAEAILDQPVREARNTAPATQTQPKEKSLRERIFDALPFSSAGAAETKGKQTFKPLDEDFYNRLAAAQDAYKTRFGKEMPVTSGARTRFEQQKLYDRWKKGDKNIYMPTNPADYPGMEVFHTNAVDISKAVPETFLREFGLHRPLGKKDPVHTVAMTDWKPSADTRMATTPTAKPVPRAASNQAAPSAVVPVQRADTNRIPPAVAQQNRTTPATGGITSILPSAQAADITPANTNTPATQTSDFDPANTNVPIIQAPRPANTGYPQADAYINQMRAFEAEQEERRKREAAKNQPKPVPSLVPKAEPKPAPTATDDTVYSPEGIPVYGGSTYQEGPKTEAPVTSLLTGAADVFLGIPEAIANVVARNIYNLPVGKEYTWEEAAEAAADNPIVKAAGYLRSGKWFGVENDPAYRKDPLSIITSLPALGVRGIAKKYGLNEEAAQLALDNALLLTPVLKKGAKGDWQVEYNVPKKQEKVPSPVTDEGIARLKTEADAAAEKVEAPRLEAPTPRAAVEVSPEGIATLPEAPAFVPSRKAGLQALAEDTRAKNEAARRLQEAENARAAAAAKGTPGAAEAFLNAHPWTKRAVEVAPFAAVSGGADYSTTPPAEQVEGPPISDTPYPERAAVRDAMREGEPVLPVDQAKKVAEQLTAPSEPTPSKPSGFSNEDILTMGLNMMMAQPGQPGGDLSQLFSNVGRSGIATLQARREREKLAQEQAFKDLYGKYVTKQTEVMGQEPPEIRTIRAFQKEPGLLDTHREMYENRTSPAMLLKTYEDARTKAEASLNEPWLAKNPDFQTWLRNSGYGGAVISPNVLEKMNLYK